MKFEINCTPFAHRGFPLYIEEEGSIIFEPSEYTDYSVILGQGYLGIDINLSKNIAIEISGCNDRHNWIKKKLAIPHAKKGTLTVLSDNMFPGMGEYYSTDWKTFYYNDWICIGNPNYKENDTHIEFANNTIATLSEDNLVALWVKLKFIKDL